MPQVRGSAGGVCRSAEGHDQGQSGAGLRRHQVTVRALQSGVPTVTQHLHAQAGRRGRVAQHQRQLVVRRGQAQRRRALPRVAVGAGGPRGGVQRHEQLRVVARRQAGEAAAAPPLQQRLAAAEVALEDGSLAGGVGGGGDIGWGVGVGGGVVVGGRQRGSLHGVCLVRVLRLVLLSLVEGAPSAGAAAAPGRPRVHGSSGGVGGCRYLCGSCCGRVASHAASAKEALVVPLQVLAIVLIVVGILLCQVGVGLATAAGREGREGAQLALPGVGRGVGRGVERGPGMGLGAAAGVSPGQHHARHQPVLGPGRRAAAAMRRRVHTFILVLDAPVTRPYAGAA